MPRVGPSSILAIRSCSSVNVVLVSLVLASSLYKHGAVLLIGGSFFSEEILKAAKLLSDGQMTILSPNESPTNTTIYDKAGFKVTVLASSENLEKSLKDAGTICIPNVKPDEFFLAFDRRSCQSLFAKLLDKGVNFIGIDNGASLMGDPAFYGDKVGEGLGLIDAVVDFDHHVKNREIRLRNAYFSSRVQLGIGLDPNECLILRDTMIEKKIGSPQVFLREAG